MKRIYLFIQLFFLLLIKLAANAQNATLNLNDASPPSTNASNSLSGLGQYDVDLYTGRLSYYAKLNNFKFSNMTFPIGVSYSSSGVKVQDMEGPVGITWKINAGGLISRYVQGLPDENPNGYCGANRTGGGNYNNPTTTWVNNVTNDDNTKTTWDSQPDKFFFSFLNFSGIFMLDPDGKPQLQSSSGIKIIYSPFNRANGRMSGGNEDWIIQDFAGNKYYFGDGATESNTVTQTGQTSKNQFTYSYISSWYISKIVTVDGQTINFQYQTFPSYNYINYFNAYVQGWDYTHSQYTYNYYTENSTIAVTNPIYLSKISSGSYELDFLYTQVYTQTPYLTSINALQNNIPEFKYQFNYITLTSTDGTYTARQALNNIKKVSVANGNSQNLFIFNYNTTQNLPARSSIQTDSWGYYNSNPGTSNVSDYGGGNESPDPVKTAANMLTSVVDVLGGTTNFIYQQNDYGTGKLTTPTGGLRIGAISHLVNGVNSQVTYSYLDPTTNSSSGQPYNGTDASYLFSYPCQYWFSQSTAGVADLMGVEVGYSWVSETKEDGSTIRRHFTNYSDYNDVATQNLFDINDNSYKTAGTYGSYFSNFPYSSFAFARGKLLSEDEIDANQNNIKSTLYSYTLSSPVGDIITEKVYPVNLPLVPGTQLWGVSRSDFHGQDLLLTSKTETDNFYTGNVLMGSTVNTESYTYENYGGNNFLASKTNSLSNGNTQKTTYRYPFDVLTSVPSTTVGLTLPMSYLVQNNIIGQPVEVATSVINGGVETLLGVSLTRYAAADNGTIKPTSQYRLTTSRGLLKSNYQSYSVTPGASSETETIDLTNLQQIQVFTHYDAAGNLIESNNPYTTDGQTASLYGYGKNYLIAQVKNATYTELFYDSFEESTLSNVVVGSAHTGTHYYSGSTYTVGWVIPDSKSYVISYWYLSGGTWKFSGVQSYTGSSMTLSAGTGYDDISIHPADALVSTYTYEPLVGVTSTGDSKGQTVSYEYDDYKRLINVRDMKGNIIKNYNYYIQGQ